MTTKPSKTLELEHRRGEVAVRYLAGQTQSSIASAMRVSQPTISNDLRAIRREWADKRLQAYGELVAEELARLDGIEQQARAGWERSQQPAETTKTTVAGDDKKTEHTTRGQVGNPRFLEIIDTCIEHRCRLLGILPVPERERSPTPILPVAIIVPPGTAEPAKPEPELDTVPVNRITDHDGNGHRGNGNGHDSPR